MVVMKAHKAVTAARITGITSINFVSGKSAIMLTFKTTPSLEVLRALDGMSIDGTRLSLSDDQAIKITNAARATDGPFAFVRGQL